MSDPKVSVIIPVYNCERYLAQAIESVLAQTFQDFEMFVVDDGSSDHSPEIIQRYVEEYPKKITYLEHPKHSNCGVSASRNLGIQHAVGQYIAFLDSDDLWLSEKLQLQVHVLDTYQDVGFTYCPIAVVDEKMNPTKEMCGTSTYGSGVPNEVRNIFEQLFSQEIVFQFCSTSLIRKHIFREVGLFDEDLGFGEDRVLSTKITYFYPVFFLPQPLVKYRVHASNVTWHWKDTKKGKNVSYEVMYRVCQWLKNNILRSCDTHDVQIKLANLALHTYQKRIISRWDYHKLLLQILPFYSAAPMIIKPWFDKLRLF
jgi:glycosyltransferase involved in cell wall biosynthesis